MMQGDSYGIPVEIKRGDGAAVTNADILDVEVVIGSLRKTYRNGDIAYTNGKWIFPLTQEESFSFPSGEVKAQVRVKWRNGEVVGCSLGRVTVNYSRSKEVM